MRSSLKEPRYYKVGNKETQRYLSKTRKLSFVSKLSIKNSSSIGDRSGAESLVGGAWTAVLAAGCGTSMAPDNKKVTAVTGTTAKKVAQC